MLMHKSIKGDVPSIPKIRDLRNVPLEFSEKYGKLEEIKNIIKQTKFYKFSIKKEYNINRIVRKER